MSSEGGGKRTLSQWAPGRGRIAGAYNAAHGGQAPNKSTSPTNKQRSRKSKRNHTITKSLENGAISAKCAKRKQVANKLHNAHGWHNHTIIARNSGLATRNTHHASSRQGQRMLQPPFFACRTCRTAAPCLAAATSSQDIPAAGTHRSPSAQGHPRPSRRPWPAQPGTARAIAPPPRHGWARGGGVPPSG